MLLHQDIFCCEVPAMLDAFPIYHWFHNGNPYSGAEGGMRYVITPGKKQTPTMKAVRKSWST